jgi:hypothetical protein
MNLMMQSNTLSIFAISMPTKPKGICYLYDLVARPQPKPKTFFWIVQYQFQPLMIMRYIGKTCRHRDICSFTFLVAVMPPIKKIDKL